MGLFKRKRKPDEETENLKAFLDMIAPSIVKFVPQKESYSIGPV